jgi:hypothetical protein
MTILSNHRLHSYKSSASKHHRVVTPKKVPQTQTGRRILIKISVTPKKSSINKKTIQEKSVVEEVKPVSLSIEGFNIYEELYGGWNPTLYNEMNAEYDLDNSMDSDEEYSEADNEEMWAHLDYLEWLID